MTQPAATKDNLARNFIISLITLAVLTAFTVLIWCTSQSILAEHLTNNRSDIDEENFIRYSISFLSAILFGTFAGINAVMSIGMAVRLIVRSAKPRDQ